jgi:Ca2+-binding EF-hand superfamily protein
MPRIVLFALLVSAMIASAGSAADDKTDKKKEPGKALAEFLKLSTDEVIKRLDKNGDGALQKDELPPALARAFDRFDKNNDGKLDRGEVEAMMAALRKRFGEAAPEPATPAKEKDKKEKEKDKPKTNDAEVDKMVDRILERLDKNKDGKISKDEAQGGLAENFDRLDANKDGFLDRQELREVAKRMLANGAGGGGPGAGRGPAIPDFDAYDKDADGRLTREEVKGTPLEALFDAMDANKDGKVSRKEFDAYYRKQAEKNPPEKTEKKK